MVELNAAHCWQLSLCGALPQQHPRDACLFSVVRSGIYAPKFLKQRVKLAQQAFWCYYLVTQFKILLRSPVPY